MAELVELRVRVPQNEQASSRSRLSFFGPLPHFSPGRRGEGSTKSTESPLKWCESYFRTAESNFDALRTVDLGPQRPFCVGECALWARLNRPQFANQVAAVVSLVEAPANHCKSTAVVKEVTAINYSNTTGHSIKKFLESPFAGKHSPFQRAPRRRRPRRQ
jgi:hypothetical protein